MEKRISFFEFQNAVSVAKLIDPYVKQLQEAEAVKAKLDENLKTLNEKIEKNNKAIEDAQRNIDGYEAGIVKIIGFHATDLVKKVMVPTGKTTPAGKAAVAAEYVPSSIVKFDEATKEYVITIVPPTTEGMPGSDYDIDKGNMPFAPQTENVSF